jgi:uncharacterized protein (DUF1499 family)
VAYATTGFLFLTFSFQATGQSIAMSPLPACPNTPNCVHQVHVYPTFPSELADAVEAALRSRSPLTLERGLIDDHIMHAVFRAGFFKDDVDVAIEFDPAGSTLYIRSASRTGRYDLGVNKRRVRRILKDLARELESRS